MAVYTLTVFYARGQSNMEALWAPINSKGQLCGIGELKAFPNVLVTINGDEKPDAKCVNECPQNEDSKLIKVEKHVGTGEEPIFGHFCMPNV